MLPDRIDIRDYKPPTKQELTEFLPEEVSEAEAKPASEIAEKIVRLYLKGSSIDTIARLTKLRPGVVESVLYDKPIQAIIDQRLKNNENDLKSLAPQVTQVIRDALDPTQPIETRLSAAERWMKLTSRFRPDSPLGNGELTAEDVVAAIVNARQNINIQINNDRRSDRDLAAGKPEPIQATDAEILAPPSLQPRDDDSGEPKSEDDEVPNFEEMLDE